MINDKSSRKNRTKELSSNRSYKKRLQEYYIKCFISEFSKVLLFLCIFMFLGLTKEYFAALLFLMILRHNGGGLHFKHYFSCLLVSFSFLYASIFLALRLQPLRLILLSCTLLCALLGYFLVPITSANRPDATKEQKNVSKRNTLIIILAFFLLVCICQLNSYYYIAFWTLILHITQLIIAHSIKEVRKNVQLGNQI